MLLSFVLCALLIGADRLFKILAVNLLKPAGAAPLLPGVIELRYVENTGAAFGMLAGRQLLLIVVTSLALVAVGYILFFKRPKNKMEYLAFLFIFTGGVGNLIDRIAQGHVVDYVNILFMHFAVFNFADILVCVGFALLIIAYVKMEILDRHKPRDGEEDEVPNLPPQGVHQEDGANADT